MAEDTLHLNKSKSLFRKWHHNVDGVKRALLIGINYSKSNNELNGCINDVVNVKNMLINKFHYKEENITLLTDHTIMKPTKQNIVKCMIELTQSTTGSDSSYIHYSGHGTQVRDLNHDEDKNSDTRGFDDAICPIDFMKHGFIIDDDLRIMLYDTLPKGAKLRAVFDCCHSGSTLDLPYLYKNNGMFEMVEPPAKNTDDCLLISGCRDHQTSADAYIDKSYSGALTWAMLECIDENEKQSWSELIKNIREKMTGHYTQIPMLSTGNKSLGLTHIDI